MHQEKIKKVEIKSEPIWSDQNWSEQAIWWWQWELPSVFENRKKKTRFKGKKRSGNKFQKLFQKHFLKTDHLERKKKRSGVVYGHYSTGFHILKNASTSTIALKTNKFVIFILENKCFHKNHFHLH